MRGEGLSRFSVKSLLSHSAENVRRGTLLCFRKLPVSKIFIHSREGSMTVFSTVFCLTVPKDSVRKLFVFQKVTVMENFMDRRSWVITIFRQKIVVSQGRRTSSRNHSLFQKLLVWKKKLWIRGLIENFRRKLFCLLMPKKH